MQRSRTLLVPCLLSIACATEVESPTGNAEDTQPTTNASIVNGRSQPTVVRMDAAQVRAVGAVMHRSGSWSTNVCTGTVIGDRVVLTAAHCVLDDNGDQVPAHAIAFATGADSAEPEQLVDVTAVHVHPSYDHDGISAEGDAAILQLAETVTRVQPLALQCTTPARTAVVGRAMQAVGYGDTNSNGSNNTRRWWAEERMVGLTSVDLVVDGMGAAGVCSGDSGGPALVTLDGQVRIMGVLSWGDPECGNRDHYALASTLCAFVAPFLAGASEMTTVEGVTFTSEQERAVLELVNQAPVAELDDDVGLDARAASNIVAARTIASLQQLAAVPWVGTTALGLLRDYAR